jgi:hypothetical protein
MTKDWHLSDSRSGFAIIPTCAAAHRMCQHSSLASLIVGGRARASAHAHMTSNGLDL